MKARCSMCKKLKDESLFTRVINTDPRHVKRNGRMSRCRECRNKVDRELRKKNPEYYRKYWKEYYHKKRKLVEEEMMKLRARSAVRSKILSGKMVRGACSKCKRKNAEAHHPDYSKPLEVVWLCRKHHNNLHTIV